MIVDQFKLDGKTALVSGASSGIGQGIAKALAEAGANIINLSSTKRSKDDTAKIVKKLGRHYAHYTGDFSNRKSLYKSIKLIKKEVPPIDILVNNAGTILRAPADEHSDEYWDKVMEVNLNSQFIITREFGNDMIKQSRGKIIFTCSLLSFQGGVNVPSYAASKAGLAGLVMAFSNEWAAKGININGIAPGYIATANTDALRNDPIRSPAILERIPAGRWGTPADIAGPAVFLASSASDYMNGSIVTVDGGWMGR